MDKKDLNEYTLKELQDIENFGKNEIFDSMILVPSNEIHDSGFRCIKGILVRNGGIVGAVSGWSDVVNPNGIENSRQDLSWYEKDCVPYMGLSIDCLVKSKCMRLIMRKPCVMEDLICSNMCFYTV